MRKNTISLAIVLAMICLLFGCTSPVEENENKHLWVLTDNHTSFLSLIENVSETFMEENPDVTIQVEAIPTAPEEQEVYLKKLRTQIMAGQGPDVFLMTQYSPLFSDVSQSMHNGLFLDISEYYDGDTVLKKDAFAACVMDAGVLDDARYILPLSFNLPILYMDTKQMESVGVDEASSGNGLTGITQLVEAGGRKSVVSEPAMLYYYFANLLPEIVDYETEEVILPKTQLVDFLSEYRDLMTLLESPDLPYAAFDMGSYISNNDFWTQKGNSAYVGTLKMLIDNLRIAKAMGTELATVPMRAQDGDLCATVTNYGAVSAGCKNPQLAYSFLRQFLLQDHQWASFRVDTGVVAQPFEGNWPVLLEGAWSDLQKDLWKSANEVTGNGEEAAARKSALRNAVLAEEDFSVLNSEISRVRLPDLNTVMCMMTISQQLNPALNPDAHTVDINALADALLQTLQTKMAEG